MKKQDNFWKANLNPVMVGTLIVMAILYIQLNVIHVRQQEKKREKQKTEKITEQINGLNAQIQRKFQSVDSLRNGVNAQVADSLMRHPEYKFVLDNMAPTDSLRTANQELLNRAYNAATRNVIFDIVRRNESVFTKFAEIPAVKNIKWQYYANKKKIRDFDARKQNVQHIPRFVQVHFDSAANAQIHKLQLELDSLLNQKNHVLKSR